MRCVHGVGIGNPCPDCEYEETCRQRGVEPQNRFKATARHTGYEPDCADCPTKVDCKTSGRCAVMDSIRR